METLGQKIRSLRMSNAYDINSMAKELGVNRTTIWQWENDRKKPTMKNRRKIAKLFKADVKELL